MVLSAMARLSAMNSAGNVLLARMPPTLPAATKTASGFIFAMKPSTCSDWRRSSSRRGAEMMSQPSVCSRRTSAEPAMPACPATKTRLPRKSNFSLTVLRPPFWPNPACSILHVAVRAVLTHLADIAFYHLAHQLVERDFVLPAELLPGLARIAQQGIGFGGPEIARIDLDENAAVARVDALFGDARAAPLD